MTACPLPVSAAPVDVAPQRRRGRGATANRSGRFERESREDFDDGWGAIEELPPFPTQIAHERPRTLITRNDSPDIGFDRSINPYRGCEHGCVYCFARPTHAYLGLSPGLDFESRLTVKDGAAELLRRELAAPSYQPKTLAIGTNTDPYQPIERRHRIMREILQVLAEAQHPLAIVTKSDHVLRDLDLLAPMAAKGLVKVALSVTTLDRGLARAMEPRASTPERRLEAIAALSRAGVPTAVMVAPVIPGVTDHEMETILTRAQAAGASEAGYILLRLPQETQDLFGGWLLENFPDKYRKVLALLRSTREGKLYDSSWGKRMTGTGPYAWTLGRRFELACERLGLGARKGKLRSDLFVKPQTGGVQLSLF
ncbi:DNA repair photolyase [Rhodoblastus acidophilus]|uniref:DNA repair photolyase n=1 Tax=Rhodoblastus acidophilus TaxID=1074 RepID=A0A212QZM2_RHOAC|nr:PA0069 family radical SAM protein [Rhodoblastus acidophilus]PPQ40520.1 radical SAM protein [Rhodoblastus acidophilus]RAI18644.1 radical SAM protein [Rhodoblastus acidophilus]SNB65198.1 DNA repair photolyase [Rhodoblastus acidophilus]